MGSVSFDTGEKKKLGTADTSPLYRPIYRFCSRQRTLPPCKQRVTINNDPPFVWPHDIIHNIYSFLVYMCLCPIKGVQRHPLFVKGEGYRSWPEIPRTTRIGVY